MATNIPTITGFNLAAAERLLVFEALKQTGSLAEAARSLVITRQKLSRLIIKHEIEYPFPNQSV